MSINGEFGSATAGGRVRSNLVAPNMLAGDEVTTITDPVTGGSTILTPVSSLKLPAGVTDLTSKVGFAGTGGRIGYNSADPTLAGGTRYCYIVRGVIEITADCSYLQLHFDAKYFQGTVLTNCGSPRQIVGYALEKIDGSLTVPFSFNGSASLTIPDGGHGSTDKLYPQAFGLTKFTKGDRYFLRAKERITAGGVHILSSYAANCDTTVIAAGQCRAEYYDEATESGVVINSTGPIPTQSGKFTTGGAHPFPQAIVGKYINAGEKSVLCISDSIDWGFGDSQGSVSIISGTGFFDRSVVNATGKTQYSSMNAAVPGTTVNQVNIPLINYYTQFANIVWHGHGVNDILASSTLPPVYLNMNVLWAALREAGVKKILHRSLLPDTTSAGGQWISKADQTVNSKFVAAGLGDQFETQLQAYVASGVLDGYCNIKSAVVDPTDSHYWRSDGVTNKLVCVDGVHPNSNGNTLIWANAGIDTLIMAQSV